MALACKYDFVLQKIKPDELVELTQNLIRIDSVIRPDRGIYEENAALYLADYLKEDGFEVIIVIRIYGKQSHGCMPLSEINPIPRMAKLVQAIEEFNDEEIAVHGKDEFLGYPSITPTIVLAPSQTEPQINVVPGELEMTLDIRTIPGQDCVYIEDRLRRILKRIEKEDKDFRATLDVIEQRPWTETPADRPVVKSVSEAYREIKGKEPVYNGVPWATDGTFLKSLKGIEIVTTGAGNRQISHQYDEYVDIDELCETAGIYALSALYYLNENGC